MREIKFRFWHTEKKVMVIDEENLMISSISHIWNGMSGTLVDTSYYKKPIFIPMQFTGLQDKNGKEIYEGDILHIKTEGWDVKGEVVWNQKKCAFNYFDNEEHNSLLEIDSNIYEVIGNIYQNPELINK